MLQHGPRGVIVHLFGTCSSYHYELTPPGVLSTMNRLTHAIDSVSLGDYESALLDIVTLIDSSAKKLYGTKKVGRRFRKLLDDKKVLIFWLFTGGRFNVDGIHVTFGTDNPKTLSELIYDPLRNALVHEAQFPKDMRIITEPAFGYDNGVFLFPRSLVLALLLMLISLPCNVRYKERLTYGLSLGGTTIDLTGVWGNEQLLIAELEKVFGRPYKPLPPR